MSVEDGLAAEQVTNRGAFVLFLIVAVRLVVVKTEVNLWPLMLEEKPKHLEV